MREIITFTLFGLLAACSGGSGTALESASLQGTVIELDGQTVDRSGVSVSVMETGETAVTDTDGRFAMAQIPTGTVTLQFGPGSQLSVEDVGPGDQVEVRCSLDDGKVVESSSSGDNRTEAETRAENGALEAKVEIESRPDREKLEVEVEGLSPGDVVELTLDGAALGSIPANAEGRAEFERIVASASDLAGSTLVISLASTGETLFTIEIPALPSTPGGDNTSGSGDRLRGRARLAQISGTAEGYVEIRSRPDEQRFKMEAERLAAGTAVAFLIEDKDNAGAFVRLAGRTADALGEAEINTQDGLPMPFGGSDVADLIGLEVRVVLDDGSGQVLLSGIVPALIAD